MLSSLINGKLFVIWRWVDASMQSKNDVVAAKKVNKWQWAREWATVEQIQF